MILFFSIKSNFTHWAFKSSKNQYLSSIHRSGKKKRRNGLSESKKKVYSITEKEKLFSSSESYHCTICLFPSALILTSALQKVSRDELLRFLQGPNTRVVQNLPQLPCVFSSHELIYSQFAWRSSSCIKTWFPKCVGRIQ